MTTPYLGEIDLFAFGFAPRGYALCNGQLLPIVQNQALFSLLGTQFGGDGQTTFALPDLRGCCVVGADTAQYFPGAKGGETAHTLSVPEMPAHQHALGASTAAGGTDSPAGAVLAQASGDDGHGGQTPYNIYVADTAPGQVLAAAALAQAGAGQAHPNMMPSTTLSYCIALQGVFPSQS
ncbi:phage tail protein [Acidisphaera rubrifaciens]|uniref:Tail collar domain-containing protein n=1 Tax=Acidisphaera rubrifaciens HS-AP3 TaxID=1231350 RepID=A0A0D6PBG5_9PROT|nr:tail fiber protein [Acidisphaera rubrifaciens]GAN78553.1 tail collar domain-containing protein [Acidisphaera rubrifaciens HS-AP3]